MSAPYQCTPEAFEKHTDYERQDREMEARDRKSVMSPQYGRQIRALFARFKPEPIETTEERNARIAEEIDEIIHRETHPHNRRPRGA